MQLNSLVKVLVLSLAVLFSTTNSLASNSCEEGDIKFADLDYVHVKLNSLGGKCTKISGPTNDADARKLCKGGYIINPGNPQYTETSPVRGTRGTNDLHYYFCLTGANFNKESLCKSLAAQRTDLNITFEKVGNDGDCMCGSKTSMRKKDCSQEIPEPGAADDQKKCEAANGKYSPSYKNEQASCQCLSDNQVINVSAGETCKDKVATEPHEPGTESPEVVSCVSEFENKMKECKTLGEATANTCDQTKETNKSVDQAKKFVSAISQAFIQNAAGSGAQAQCAGANLLSTGTYQLMNQLKASCDTELKECRNKCDEVKSDVIEYCKNKISPEADDITKKNNEAYLAKENTRLSPLVVEGKKLCLVKAVANQDLLKDALNAYDGAAKSAAMCACQLSSASANVNCAALPSPADCTFNPNQPQCSGPGALNCVVGSPDFTTPKCQCLADPSLTICKVEPGKVPFAFAGDIKAINAGGGVAGVGGGSGGSGNLDLGGIDNPQDARTDDKGAQGSAPGFGTASGGGSGGGGGGSGGGDGTGAAAAGEAGDPAEKNLGLFGMAKSAMSSLFGKGGSAAGKDVRNKNATANPDAEKWRPRGLASTGCKSSQIRCKNETIWDIMNTRYGSDENTFIQKP